MLIESNVFEWVNDPIRYLSTATAAEMKNNLFIAVSGTKTGKGKAFTPPYLYTMTDVGVVENFVRGQSGRQDLYTLVCHSLDQLLHPQFLLTSYQNASAKYE